MSGEGASPWDPVRSCCQVRSIPNVAHSSGLLEHASPRRKRGVRFESVSQRLCFIMTQKRTALVEHVPKALKRGNRTRAPGIPANIRVDGLSLDVRDRVFIRRRLGEKLGRYARSVERVSVRLRDINGPRGGVDVRIRIKVVLSGQPSVVVERQDAALRPALTAALAGAERAVRRTLQRRRQRPKRAGR